MTGIFVKIFFCFKGVCLIEVTPNFMQEKTAKFIFSLYAVFAVRVN